MFAHRLKLILLSQPISTLNNYTCSLPPLDIVDWCAFPECFCWLCKYNTGEMVPKDGFQLSCRDLIWLPLSVHVCLGLVVEYWPFLETCTVHIIPTLTSIICVILLLCLSFCHHQPHPHTSGPTPYIYSLNINEFNENKLIF